MGKKGWEWRAFLLQGKGTEWVPISPICNSAGEGRSIVPFPSSWEYEWEWEIYTEKGCCCRPCFSLMCLPGRFPSPQNRPLITVTHYTTNIYFANEKHPPRRPLKGCLENRKWDGERELEADRPAFQSSLSLSLDVWSWGSHFTFVGLSFLINRMEMIVTSTSQSWLWEKIEVVKGKVHGSGSQWANPQ